MSRESSADEMYWENVYIFIIEILKILETNNLITRGSFIGTDKLTSKFDQLMAEGFEPRMPDILRCMCELTKEGHIEVMTIPLLYQCSHIVLNDGISRLVDQIKIFVKIEDNEDSN